MTECGSDQNFDMVKIWVAHFVNTPYTLYASAEVALEVLSSIKQTEKPKGVVISHYQCMCVSVLRHQKNIKARTPTWLIHGSELTVGDM